MAISRGFIEILQMANSDGPKRFNDFTKIVIKRTALSSATVSKRLDELIAIKAIDQVITKSKFRRGVITYKVTDKGRRIIKLAIELQNMVDFKDNTD